MVATVTPEALAITVHSRAWTTAVAVA